MDTVAQNGRSIRLRKMLFDKIILDQAATIVCKIAAITSSFPIRTLVVKVFPFWFVDETSVGKGPSLLALTCAIEKNTCEHYSIIVNLKKKLQSVEINARGKGVLQRRVNGLGV